MPYTSLICTILHVCTLHLKLHYTVQTNQTHKQRKQIRVISFQNRSNLVEFWCKLLVLLDQRNGIKCQCCGGKKCKGAIPCQRFEKKGQHQKVDFFDDIGKIIRQMDDFGHFLNNFCNFCLFLAPKKKIPKNDCFEKVKIEEKSFFFYKRLNNLYHSYSMNFMILLICFVICNGLGRFLPF